MDVTDSQDASAVGRDRVERAVRKLTDVPRPVAIEPSDATARAPTHKPRNEVLRIARKIVKRIVVFSIWGWLAPRLLIFYLILGAYEVGRHGRDLGAVAFQFFMTNGILTWVLSPLNVLIDILSLPFVNKRVYRLEDLPAAHQAEIRTITEQCKPDEIIADVEARRTEHGRTMLLYKWYTYDSTTAKNELFQRDYDYILTVGVSTFRSMAKTDRHFGWLRAGVRVLYNLDPGEDEGAYIIANGIRHTWCVDGPLFIFDDTVMHQSFNDTDHDRHCLFIDVLRPSYVSFLFRGMVKFMGFLSLRMTYFTKSSNWRLI